MAKFYAPTKLSENIHETPEGFLLCLNVPIARTGWQDYAEGETPLEVGPNGIVKIYRDAKEVFRPQTVASFEGKPITVKHPSDFVTPQNWSNLAKGIVQNVRKGDTDEDGEQSLIADVLITDDFTIQLVKAGLREVSCGYEAEYEQTGEGEGRQTNIVGNHLALVEQGRAGESYAINDAKGKVIMNKAIEKLKLKFGAKVVDEAMKDAEKEDNKPMQFDELVKMVSDIGEVVKGFGEKMDRVEGFVANKKADGGGKGVNMAEKKFEINHGKDEDKEEMESKDKDEIKEEGTKGGEDEDMEEKSKDDMDPAEDKEENEAEAEILQRVTALESALAKLLKEKNSKDEDKEEEESEDEDMEESEDEDDTYGGEKHDKSEDDLEGVKGEESQKKTSDEVSRIEILAPGLKKTKGMNIKKEALKTAYSTKDGKEVILALNGGKEPNFESTKRISTLFIAASEVLKEKRGTGLGKTKDAKAFDGEDQIEPVTIEKINALNAAIWARK